MSETKEQINLFHLDVELKMKALEKRGVLQCKFPDILIGNILMRVDHTDPEKPKLQAGNMHIMADDSLQAGWFLAYDAAGVLQITDDMEIAKFIPELLDRYNAALDQLMVISDNGLLT